MDEDPAAALFHGDPWVAAARPTTTTTREATR
jgi:hypothetical protein